MNNMLKISSERKRVIMLKLRPHFVYDEHQKKVGVILSIDDFERLIGELPDKRSSQPKKRVVRRESIATLEEVMRETLWL